MGKKISYKKSGVDLKFANAIVPKIRKLVSATRRPEVLADIGPFAALFQLRKYRNPILVSSADGVGTKLTMALKLNKLESIGIDLVAMNVNDVLAMGAEPLFFLDHIGLGRDQRKLLYPLIRGMARGAKLSGAALVGGETAEMLCTYGGKRLGLAGFAVGVAERHAVVDGKNIREGDALIGLASSGLHANGFSLINRVFKPRKEFLVPTRIYVKSILPILKKFTVHGLAHITGGGLHDNIRRILPGRLNAVIKNDAWPIPSIFREIREKAGISEHEMFHTFNMGIGFVIIVPNELENPIMAALSKTERVFPIGTVIKGGGKVMIQ
ncbi:MAG: Phosphoribosylformylglycinamidine cyclo-ligase [Parcubacteria group bacterium GW2011_GWA1_51_12]|nr:MAG: Phosphoribosylformylglycinamidine cyclo-ligase [Parcubacteria group bacterium GW2011_GWA1_51_12]